MIYDKPILEQSNMERQLAASQSRRPALPEAGMTAALPQSIAIVPFAAALCHADVPAQVFSSGELQDGEGVRILIIDDNAMVLDLYRRILTKEQPLKSAELAAIKALFTDAEPNKHACHTQFLVDTTESGQDGCGRAEVALEDGKPYAVAFVDMRMPGGWDGLKTVETLWAIDPDLQVVICTAYSDHSWDEIVARLGASGRLLILHKPFEEIEVLQLASALAAKWSLQRRHAAQSKERQRRLVESEERFRRSFEDAAHGMGLQRLDGRFADVNEAFCRIVGYSKDDLLERDFQSITHPDDVSVDLVHNEEMLAGETAKYQVEKRYIRGDGRVISALVTVGLLREPSGAPLYYIAQVLDITQRREAEERFRLLAENTNDLVCLLGRDSTLLYVSPSARRLLGYDAATMAGQTFYDFVHPDDAAIITASHKRILTDRQAVLFPNYRLRKDDGSYVWFETSAQPVLDADGKLLHIVASARDITKRIAVEHELRQAQKMEAVGQLTGGVAHDFNNILQTIIGCLQLFGSNSDGSGNDRQLRDLALNAGMRGAELTQRLLAFARRQPLDPKPIEVNDLVMDAVSLMRHTLGDNINVRTNLADSLDTILIDPSQLESALLNLAINARDAMPEGGTLLIETAPARLDAAYAAQHPDARPGKYVMISVSDQGTGIAPEILPHVFEPFFTTKEVGKGSGLGLSMVYGFIKQSEGHVRIYSEVGHGTTVRLYLPICRASSANAPHPVEAINLPRGMERILLVEDDDGVRQFLTVLLTEFGYEVVAVANSADLPEVMSHDVTFDMLITDIVLPGGRNGKEVAEIARPRLRKPRVLFISGYPRDAVVQNARLEEAVDFISKPFTREVILNRVREILDRV